MLPSSLSSVVAAGSATLGILKANLVGAAKLIDGVEFVDDLSDMVGMPNVDELNVD
jgi:hypothetical protein